MGSRSYPGGVTVFASAAKPVTTASEQLGAFKATISSVAKTVTTLASDATSSIPTGATWMRVAVESQAVRYLSGAQGTLDATTGIPVAAGSFVDFDVPNLGAVRFIRQSSDATLQFEFFCDV
jgi:hypothetical protein